MGKFLYFFIPKSTHSEVIWAVISCIVNCTQENASFERQTREWWMVVGCFWSKERLINFRSNFLCQQHTDEEGTMFDFCIFSTPIFSVPISPICQTLGTNLKIPNLEPSEPRFVLWNRTLNLRTSQIRPNLELNQRFLLHRISKSG